MKQYIPWIYEEDIRYAFGIRKSAFNLMTEFGINKAFFSVIPSTYISDGFMCETISSIKEISEYCKQFGVEPLFSFPVPWYDLTSVLVIPKTENALRMFLKFLDNSRICAIDCHDISSMLTEYRGEFLLGEKRHNFHASRLWYKPFDFSKTAVSHENAGYNSDNPANNLIEPYDFFFADYIHDYEHDVDFYKKCKKISMPYIIRQQMFSSGDNIKLFRFISPKEIIGKFEKFDKCFSDYTLFLSSQKLAEKIEKYDALEIIDSIC